MTHDPLHGRHELATYYFDPRYSDGGVVSDHSGRGNDLTPNGGVSTDATAGPTGFGASELDGTDDYWESPDSLAVSGDNAVATVLRVDVFDNGNFDCVYRNRSGSNGLELTTDDSVQRLTLEAYDGSGNNVSFAVTTDVPESKFFTFVQAVHDGELKGFIDGELKNSRSISGYTAGQAPFRFGSTGGSAFLPGVFAFVGRYDLTVPTAPEPAEIARRVDELTSVPRTRL